MAKGKQQNINSTVTDTFIKGLNKDSDATFIKEGMWAHARNAVNNTLEGDLGTLSNERSNVLCTKVLQNAPVQYSDIKKIIGVIHLFADKWVIFSCVNSGTNPKQSLYSEIGLFEEDNCTYKIISEQSQCLNFSMYHLITGASRLQEDCSWGVYFADGNNPDRYINIGDPKNWPDGNYLGNNYYEGNTLWPTDQWAEKCFIDTSAIDDDCYEPGQGCLNCTQLNYLNCDGIRLARILETPCLNVKLGNTGGSLLNGSYMALVAYSIKGQKVTNWFSPSNVQPVWFEEEPGGSLEIDVKVDQATFDEFILCIVSIVNQNTVAKQYGIYNTTVSKIVIDNINPTLVSIPIEQLPIQSPVYEKSKQIVQVNNYLLRVAPTSRFDFNYQPLANLIKAKWQSVEYDADYYIKGGHKPSYLRDEVYTFFIRWVYDTGEKSSSYHIPGRPSKEFINPCTRSFVKECSKTSFTTQNKNVIEAAGEKVFDVFNTAEITSLATTELEDGGLVIAEGDMGYWESKELYPANQPDVYNSSSQCWTGTVDPGYDLCGKPIRHHKFPEQSTGEQVHHFTEVNGDFKIRILGVAFENIILPKDNDGNDIPGIVGYEILRGSREGNRSIVAKGMINNMRPYNIIRSNGASNIKGLYPNYPFNTIAPINPSGGTASGTLNGANNINDPYIINVELEASSGVFNPTKLKEKSLVRQDMPKNIITFHSPDTNFKQPFLSARELKLYGYFTGTSLQYFSYPDRHPRHKVMTNGIIIAMIVGGIVNSIVQSLGKTTVNSPKPVASGTGGDVAGIPAIIAANGIAAPASIIWETFLKSYKGVTAAADILTGNFAYTAAEEVYLGALKAAAIAGGHTTPTYDISYEDGVNQYFGIGLAAATGLQRFYFSFSEGADDAIEIMRQFTPFRQYALQMKAHGLYDTFKQISCEYKTRFIIDSALYLKTNSNQRLRTDAGNNQYQVNNLLRQRAVTINTKSLESNTDGPEFIDVINSSDKDESLITVGTSGMSDDIWSSLQDGVDNFEINKTISSHYAAIKIKLTSQYGQLGSVNQIPIASCEQVIKQSNLSINTVNCNGVDVEQKVITRSPIFFGGDTYINRYTEKNNMFFFNTWLYGEPDGAIFNYYLNQSIPQARFWLNTEPYDASNLLSLGGASELIDLLLGNTNLTGSGALPRQFYKLDTENYNYDFSQVFSATNPPVLNGYPGLFAVKRSFFYLANSSVRDFFVESEVLVDFREQGNLPFERHYNPYGFNDLNELLNINPDWLTRGNTYLYDYSLSVTKLFTQYFSQGNLQQRFYDPNVASQCFTEYPDRLVYSLPQQQESVKDSWFTYLADNYKNYQDEIAGIKNFAKTGIFIAFKNASPLILQGVDQLETDLGTKITLGDGGLFAKEPQAVTNADRPYEYGSCQNRLSIINTPVGMFYASQNQGKIFAYGKGLQEISSKSMKWWFNNFLPYKILEDFPEYPHTDNPVAGVGVHASFNNYSTILYFSKRDFRLKIEYKGLLEYDLEKDVFYITALGENSPVILLGDPKYFDDASWTISYDPKNQYWISFHDWHPNLFMPSKHKFYTTKEDGIYEHASSCASYCNFYGVDYPFEIDIPVATGQQVNTIRSLEYILECYKRDQFNCVDQFHVLDQNFDKLIVYNTEQVSGMLELLPYPKNNPFVAQQYPQLIPAQNAYQILFSKEENKYRINQFWDITRDRGEFTGAEENIWVTEPNGYVKNLNSLNLDYLKSPQERKKFRHYANFLHLRKEVSEDINMILKIVNTKKTYSPR
jgi:hypothetical protein